jgi:hypothetical protein
MLSKPDYIARARIDVTEVTYHWHDWRAFEYCQPVDDEFVARCSTLLESAVNAFTIAVAEWLMFRYDRLSSDQTPYLHLESAWCANVDRRYSWPIEFPREDWQGPLRRPMFVGIVLVNHPLYELEYDEETISPPAMLSRLLQHVLPDSERFLEWRQKCLERLERFYRREDRDPFEDLFEDQPRITLVPREVFDPAFDFTPEMALPLTNRFLRSIDYAANPFLLTPQQMRIEGFTGSPYSV